MCRRMMRRSPAPRARAACTKSVSRSERNSPRTSRAAVVQPAKAMARMTTIGLAPHRATISTIRKKVGMREDDVHQAHDRVVDAAADVAGDGAQGDADDDQDRDRREGHEERRLERLHEPDEVVLTDGVEAERREGVDQRWRVVGQRQARLLVGVAGDRGDDDGHRRQGRHHDQADDRQAVLHEALADQLPVGPDRRQVDLVDGRLRLTGGGGDRCELGALHGDPS